MKRADSNPLKEWMSCILLGSSFQNFAHSYLKDFLAASEEEEHNVSSGMASPLLRSIRLRVSKSSAKYFGWPKRRALKMVMAEKYIRLISIVSQPNCRLAGVTWASLQRPVTYLIHFFCARCSRSSRSPGIFEYTVEQYQGETGQGLTLVACAIRMLYIGGRNLSYTQRCWLALLFFPPKAST